MEKELESGRIVSGEALRLIRATSLSFIRSLDMAHFYPERTFIMNDGRKEAKQGKWRGDGRGKRGRREVWREGLLAKRGIGGRDEAQYGSTM